MYQQKTNINKKNKFLGSLLGSFVGDALGYIIKGSDSKLVKNYLKCIDSLQVLEYGKAYNNRTKLYVPAYNKNINNNFIPFGQYTDNARIIRETLITIFENNGNFNYEHYTKKMINLGNYKFNQNFNDIDCNYYSINLKKFYDKINLGVSYKFSGIENKFTTESAVRSTIFGLLFSNNEQSLINVVSTQSMITHLSSMCAAGSVAISVMVALIYNNEKINAETFLRKASMYVKNINCLFSQYLLQLINMIKLPSETVYPLIRNINNPLWDKRDLKINDNVITNVLWSIYCFFKYSDNFMYALYEAISVGGDVHNVASMVGAMSGAHLGINVIPKQFMSRLNDKGKYNGEDIFKMGECIYNGMNKIKLNESQEISTMMDISI